MCLIRVLRNDLDDSDFDLLADIVVVVVADTVAVAVASMHTVKREEMGGKVYSVLGYFERISRMHENDLDGLHVP
jgi:hypothetical protein